MATGAAVAEDIRQPDSRKGSRQAHGAGMAQTGQAARPAHKVTGRLGLEDGSSFTFIRAVDAAATALEDAGINTVPAALCAAPGMRLSCAGFEVLMRLRRPALRPSRQQRSDLLQPAALLDISVLPEAATPEAGADAQTVLAGLLRRLVAELEAVSVEWLDTGVLLTGDQFLAASERPAPQPAVPPVPQPPRVQPARVVPAAKGTASRSRPRGRACFAPVELAAQRIDAQCEMVLRQVEAANADTGAEARAEPAELRAPVKARPFARVATLLPRLLRRAASGTSRTGQPRFAGQVLMLAFLMYFAETTAVVQAGLPLLP